MTSDDERWERDLRAGLGTLLADVAPAAVPTAAVLRKGRAMRVTRRLGVAAGVVVVAGAVTATVTLLPATAGRHREPAAGASRSVVIARGAIQGHAWRIVVDQAAGRLCAGEVGLRQSCVSLRSLEHLNGLVSLSGAMVAVPHAQISFGPPIWNALFGIVRPDVTRVAMRMSNGRTVSLRPVAAAGYRWIGLIWVPNRVAVAKATVYSGGTELGYAVPFYGGELRPGTYWVSWYRPGEAGPAQRSMYIATGGSGGNSWGALVLAGPWGYCVSLDAPVDNGAQQNCWSPSSLRARPRVIMRFGSPPVVPRWIVGTARPSVAYLRMTLADGRAVKVPVSVFSGQGFYAMQIGRGPAIIGWGAYDAAGHQLYGGRGAPDASH